MCSSDLPKKKCFAGSPYSNNVGVILWHVTRAEDNLIPRLENGSTLWAVGMRSLASPWMRRIQLIG